MFSCLVKRASLHSYDREAFLLFSIAFRARHEQYSTPAVECLDPSSGFCYKSMKSSEFVSFPSS